MTKYINIKLCKFDRGSAVQISKRQKNPSFKVMLIIVAVIKLLKILKTLTIISKMYNNLLVKGLMN